MVPKDYITFVDIHACPLKRYSLGHGVKLSVNPSVKFVCAALEVVKSGPGRIRIIANWLQSESHADVSLIADNHKSFNVFEEEVETTIAPFFLLKML